MGVFKSWNCHKGITPLDISEVVEGSHTYKLTKFGYASMEKKIDVSAGKREPVDETLSIAAWLRLLIEGGLIGGTIAGLLAIRKWKRNE